VECGTDKGLVLPALPGAVAVWSVALIRVWCHLIYRVLLQQLLVEDAEEADAAFLASLSEKTR